MDKVKVKQSVNVIKIFSIITFIVALLLFICSLFNQHKVMFNLFGYQFQGISMVYVIVWAFVAGTVYAGILGIINGIRSGVINSNLRKLMKEMKEEYEK